MKLKSCCLSPAGRMVTGSRFTSIAGVNSPRLRAHASHRWRCSLTRVRSRAVSSPFQPSSMAAKSRQSSGPGLLTSSTPNDVSNLDRTRETSAASCLRGMPRTSARSPPSRPLRMFSSTISRSPGDSAASAACTTAQSSACSAPASPTSSVVSAASWRGAEPASPTSSVVSAASWRGAEETPAGCLRWHSLRVTANSHARRRSGSRSSATLDEAMTKVSYTASAASARSLSWCRQ